MSNNPNQLPWRKVEHNWSDTTIYDAAGMIMLRFRLTEVVPERIQQELEKRVRERSDLILRAVNSHEDLVTACETAENLLADFQRRVSSPTVDATLAVLRAALAKAKPAA